MLKMIFCQIPLFGFHFQLIVEGIISASWPTITVPVEYNVSVPLWDYYAVLSIRNCLLNRVKIDVYYLSKVTCLREQWLLKFNECHKKQKRQHV